MRFPGPAGPDHVPVHRRWIHQCWHSDLHVSQVSGHRWCRPCKRALEVAVDEVLGTVAVRCRKCARGATLAPTHN
ncbi:hypothetical protein AMETH_3725 [Amycolatopsis methanolica 239]|uniref:Uncharacterized protein n=1 Tax=Amycolatopsis methanolica 239 TaxID=1068978 RepID=A0A076N1L1_AMYME|nr:hypothetical protein AMETH_3725 [Amycolatopsis methanolica 239]